MTILKTTLALKQFCDFGICASNAKGQKTRRAEVEVIKENLNKLSKLEKENCDDLDQGAHCFANILKAFYPVFLPKMMTWRL